MVTSVALIGKCRSNNLDQEIDITLRFPERDRNMKTIENLFINTVNGLVVYPVRSIVKYASENKINKLSRISRSGTVTIFADVDHDYLADERVKFIQDSIV